MLVFFKTKFYFNLSKKVKSKKIIHKIVQNFVEDYTITYKNAILDSCLSGWLAGWLAVCGTQKGPTSLTTIAKKNNKKERERTLQH